MKKTLEITLRSDLCAGVGKHYAAIIDLDTAIDNYGLPYIPSRRLKGCMREVADFIECEKINEIFGKNGSQKPGYLCLGNAVIKGYRDIISEIRNNNIPHNEVTDLFCSTKAQTAIDYKTSTAKDKSLRFIRVVNKNMPFSNEETRFYADLEFDDDYYEDINNICLGLRNIGYQRNRGLGAIECRLIDYVTEIEFYEREFKDSAEYIMSYLIQLESDLMIPATDSNHSLDYIPGTSVLGALASVYKGNNFNDVFLSGKARFENLYISDSFGNDYIPAPRFLARIKAPLENEKGIKNTIGIDIEKNDKDKNRPVQYKYLKKGYINDYYGYCEPETKIVYHNRINGDDKGLYVQYCLSEGQFFKGNIIANGSVMREIYPLFKSGIIQFGRSKTAQYSRCKLINKIEVNEYIPDDVKISAGTFVAFVLKSDVVLTGKNGCYLSSLISLVESIQESIDKDNTIFSWFDLDDCATDKTTISTRVISGYNAKWNLIKPQFVALKAGSVVVARAQKEASLPEEFLIGEKLNEGFGIVKVIPNSDKFSVKAHSLSQEKTEKSIISKLIEAQRKNDEVLSRGIKKAKEVLLNASQCGRVVLMCKEAEDFNDFENRLKSIKTESVSNHALNLFSQIRIKEDLGEDYTWANTRKYIITALNVRKYTLRQKEDKNEF